MQLLGATLNIYLKICIIKYALKVIKCFVKDFVFKCIVRVPLKTNLNIAV